MRRRAAGIVFLTATALLFRFVDSVIGIASSTRACTVMLALGLLVTTMTMTERRLSVRTALSAIAVFAVFAAGIMATVNSDHPRDRFHRVYWRIQPGMTPDEVESLVNAAFPDEKPIGGRSNGTSMGYRLGDRLCPEADSDCIAITLKKGRVAAVEYLPD